MLKNKSSLFLLFVNQNYSESQFFQLDVLKDDKSINKMKTNNHETLDIVFNDWRTNSIAVTVPNWYFSWIPWQFALELSSVSYFDKFRELKLYMNIMTIPKFGMDKRKSNKTINCNLHTNSQDFYLSFLKSHESFSFSAKFNWIFFDAF